MGDPRDNWRLLAVHVALAATCGVLLAVADALVAARGNGHAWLSVWIAIGCAAPVAATWGLLQKPVASALVRTLERSGILPWIRRHAGQDRTLPREPTILAHTLSFLGAVCTGLLLVSVWRVRYALRTIQDETLQSVLLLAALGLLVLGLVVLLLLLKPPVSRILTRFDERFGLPWPRSPLIRFFVAVFLPTVAFVVPLAREYRDDLGNVLLPFEFLVFVELQIMVFLVGRLLGSRGQRRVVGGSLGIFLVTALAQPITFARVEAAKTVSERGTFVPRVVALLRRATDFDRDGFSGLYAGGDCAPFDSRVNPRAEDVPRNGRDENCDGKDASSTSSDTRGATFSGALQPSQIKKYNIVWIVVDALRPDSMHLYGSKRLNTPTLDELSRSALKFDRAYAGASTTHLSIPGMLAGKNAERAVWEYRGDKARVHLVKNTATLATRLKPLGYGSAAIVSPHIHGLGPALAGFDSILSTSTYRLGPSRGAPVSTALGIDFLHRDVRYLSGEKPFFLFVYYEGPHKPYDLHGARFPEYGRGDKERYDGEIGYVDSYIGSLLDHLSVHTALWANTLVIVTSDHGEEFRDHGSVAHGRTCYEESAHVPLLFRIPGVRAKEVSRRVSLVDIVPTVLDLLGATAVPTDLDGQSLFFAERDEGVAQPSFCAITNQGGNAGSPFFRRSVRFDSRSLIHDVLTNEFELYDVDTDPAETTNLVTRPQEAATVAKLKGLLVANATGNLFQQRLP